MSTTLYPEQEPVAVTVSQFSQRDEREASMAVIRQAGPWRDEGKDSVLKVKAQSEIGPTELVAESSESTGKHKAASESDEGVTHIALEHEEKPTGFTKAQSEIGPTTIVSEWPPPPKDEASPDEPKEAVQEAPTTRKRTTRKAKPKVADKAQKPAANKSKGGK